MIIIKHLAKSIKAYERLYQNVPPLVEEVCLCCETHPKLHRHGRFYRTVVTKHSFYRIPIYRLKCPNCSKTFSILPDFLSPYRVFIGLIQESVFYRHFIKGDSYANVHQSLEATCLGSITLRTMKRWCKRWREHIEAAIQYFSMLILHIDPFFATHTVIKKFHVYETFLNLTKILWKKIHPSTRYPFYGLFPWINQLINR